MAGSVPWLWRARKGEPGQAQHVTGAEATATAGEALNLDLSVFDHDQRVPPFGLVAGSSSTGKDPDCPKVGSVRCRPRNERAPGYRYLR